MLARLLVFATAAAWTVHAAGAVSGIALVMSAILTRAIPTRSTGRSAGAG